MKRWKKKEGVGGIPAPPKLHQLPVPVSYGGIQLPTHFRGHYHGKGWPWRERTYPLGRVLRDGEMCLSGELGDGKSWFRVSSRIA